MNFNIKQNTNPVLFEKLISELNVMLLDKVEWLNNAFGRAYSVINKKDNAEYVQPAIYVNNSEYFSVLPNDIVGNFSFVIVNDPQVYDGQQVGKGILKASAYIVFWFDLKSIFADEELLQGATENVKLELIKYISTPGYLSSGRIDIISIDERAENVYKGFSLKQIDTQHLMHPYCGFRFNCEFKIHELC